MRGIKKTLERLLRRRKESDNDLVIGFKKDKLITGEFAENFLNIMGYKIEDKGLWSSLHAYSVKVKITKMDETIKELSDPAYSKIICYVEQNVPIKSYDKK